MNRRNFLAGSAAGFASAAIIPAGAAENASDRQIYELRRYQLDPAKATEQKRRLERFLGDAAIPALNRLGIRPIGAFHPREGEGGPVYVLIPHPTLESAVTLIERLSQDGEFLQAGEDFINASAENPAYQRIETSFHHAFTGMPRLETPVRSPGRVLQLRVYESPSAKTGLKKIEMFNEAGEIRIFRESGLHPIFFGRTIAGANMPNLTYMLGFESEDELKANWDKFRVHPDWQELKAMEEYANDRILSGITNILLSPAECSQI